ncbi:MAG: hypothetical protein R3C28_10120 [Pirellulaceae bacterium]
MDKNSHLSSYQILFTRCANTATLDAASASDVTMQMDRLHWEKTQLRGQQYKLPYVVTIKLTVILDAGEINCMGTTGRSVRQDQMLVKKNGRRRRASENIARRIARSGVVARGFHTSFSRHVPS